MDLKNLLLVFQIIVSIILTAAVLLQVRGNGLGRVWGSQGSYFARRGIEKLVFRATFVLTAVFITVSIALLLV